MFTVIVVDDEPAALIYMRQLICLVNSDFKIIGEYPDSVSCLKELKEKQPDVVISDICMPGESGLELVKEIKAEYPNTVCLILSGYSEFEYAREAIKGRVYEYLLKPILPDEFISVMNRIRMAVSAKHMEERDNLIRNMSMDREVESNKLMRYFGAGSYYAILMRKNGLPGTNIQETKMSVSSDLYEQITVYGCDEREALCIIPQECTEADDLLIMGEKLRKGLESEGDIFTTVYTEDAFTTEKMPETIRHMYQKLYQVIIPGKEAVYRLAAKSELSEISRDNILVVERVRELLTKNKGAEAYLEFERLCEDWIVREVPEKFIWYVVRYIFHTYWMFSENQINGVEQMKLLDNLLFESVTVREMCENVKILFNIHFQIVQSGKIDTEVNYFKIKKYILDHLKDAISLSSLSQKFGISVAYLTRMFRKYEGMSYNQFLIHARIEEAKKLLILHPDWFIKDVAALVGYPDQFYFSRVFRSYTGRCPSDYSGGEYEDL